MLLDAGADIEAKNKDGETPLANAAWNYNRSDAMIQALLNAGASIERSTSSR